MKFREFLQLNNDAAQAILKVIGGFDGYLDDNDKQHLLSRKTSEFSDSIKNQLINLGFIKSISSDNLALYNDIVNSIKSGIPVVDLIKKVEK